MRGYSSNNWNFPRGKINKGESKSRCAAREVYEETSCDISALVREDDFIEAVAFGQLVRLYIVVGVDEATQFAPRTRKEIRVRAGAVCNGKAPKLS